jgi:formylglycine-generating enzyme
MYRNVTLLIFLGYAAILQAYSQNVIVKTDKDCSFLIDGIVENQLKANNSVEIALQKGKHTIVAKTIDSNLNFREVFTIDSPHVVQISFSKQIKYIEKKRRKKEKRNRKIALYKSKKPEIVNEISDNMVLVDGGKFKMGSNTGETDEQPLRKVTVSDFYISKYEVTQKQWMAVMGNNPSHFFDCDDCPVENVHWYDAIVFCNTLGELSGFVPYYTIDSLQMDTCNQNFYDHIKWTVTINEEADGYRLPTEAEWEYAAGNSKDYLYSGSNTADKVAWTLENANGSIHPVGQKQPNNHGLYDMSGNVWEFCFDWYSGNYYSLGENNNPKGAKKSWVRVIRGGSWMAHSQHSRIKNRDREGADNPTNFTGIRIVRTK